MSAEIITLDFQGNQVRNLVKEDGSVWFVASDVCRVLGIVNCPDALKRLYDYEKNSIVISDRNLKRGNPNKNIISESGLYKLIMRSTKPEAIKFQDWVTQEVLPTIRKDGGYINPNDYRDPYKIMKNMMIQAKKMDETIKRQKIVIEDLKPKAQMLESFFNGVEDDISFNTLAKMCKFVTDNNKPVGGLLLKNKCIEEGFISKRDRLPRQEFVNKGYFKVFYTKVFNRNEGMIVAPKVLITPKGQRFLYDRLQDCFDIA